jgi:hypothetical protein
MTSPHLPPHGPKNLTRSLPGPDELHSQQLFGVKQQLFGVK